MNRRLRKLLGVNADNPEVLAKPLPPELVAELEQGFEEFSGCILRCISGRTPFEIEADEDETGIECQSSKVNFRDYHRHGDPFSSMLEMGIAYAFALFEHLQQSGLTGSFRVILGADAEGEYPSVTVRYHRQRPGQEWLGSDIEAYSDGVMAVDFDLG